jgi:menaquinone-dependent protoporphyrinogen oxidase
MRTLVVFASKYGATEECAEKLKEKLGGDVTVVKLGKNTRPPDLSEYDTVIVGGSIHAGRIQKAVRDFCMKNLDTLKAKNLGLFVSSLTPPEKAVKYITDSFPGELVEGAKAKGCFGGALYYEKMNFLERFVMKKITKSDRNIYSISEQNIQQFAEQMKG